MNTPIPVDDGTTDPLELEDMEVDSDGLGELAEVVEGDPAEAPVEPLAGDIDHDLAKELEKVEVPVEEEVPSTAQGKKSPSGYTQERIDEKIGPEEFWKEGVYF